MKDVDDLCYLDLLTLLGIDPIKLITGKRTPLKQKSKIIYLLDVYPMLDFKSFINSTSVDSF